MNNLPTSTPTTRRETFANGLTVRVDEQGSGRPILVLHGGGGPRTVAGLANSLSAHAHVLVPTHPGFGGEPRPEWFNNIDDLAIAYLDLLERLALRDVMVIGSSMGGWIASEMAVRDTSRLSSIVLMDAAGIHVDGHPIVDVFPLAPDQLAALSYHNPAAFRIDPATLGPEQSAAIAANFRALKVYTEGGKMEDTKLGRRLSRVNIPTLVVWGESDRVIDPDYGRAYAQSFPSARFELIPEAGHLPQMEQPARVLKVIQEFTASIPTTPPIAR